MSKRGIDVTNSCIGAETLQAKKIQTFVQSGGGGGEKFQCPAGR
mgnify:CR=1 FL=1